MYFILCLYFSLISNADQIDLKVELFNVFYMRMWYSRLFFIIT